jgi:hypothetical protein
MFNSVLSITAYCSLIPEPQKTVVKSFDYSLSKGRCCIVPIWTFERFIKIKNAIEVSIHDWNCFLPDFSIEFAVTLPLISCYVGFWVSSVSLHYFSFHISRPWSTFSSSLCSHGSCTHEPHVAWKRSNSGPASKNFSSPSGLCSVWTAETQKHSFSLRSVSCGKFCYWIPCLS